jgi:hypothetical protein
MYLFILGFGSGGIEELYYHFDLTAMAFPHPARRKGFAMFRKERDRKM